VQGTFVAAFTTLITISLPFQSLQLLLSSQVDEYGHAVAAEMQGKMSDSAAVMIPRTVKTQIEVKEKEGKGREKGRVGWVLGIGEMGQTRKQKKQ
jgi:hypothetical protein